MFGFFKKKQNDDSEEKQDFKLSFESFKEAISKTKEAISGQITSIISTWFSQKYLPVVISWLTIHSGTAGWLSRVRKMTGNQPVLLISITSFCSTLVSRTFS